ncbi:MAG: hypothetical protein EOM68_28465, partial [Spirochaetia bacterium]|nr:hypothetical protein [Spirochaetia bacterium]
MTQYPLLPDYPLSHPVDPNAPSGPYVPILYHVDADTQRFISPLTWRPPLMAQALPHIRFSAITTFKIKPYSNGVPLIIDTQSLVLVRIADRDRTPVHSTYATASEDGYYTVTLDLVNLPANVSEGQGFIELSINDVVLLSDRCTLGSALWSYDEQPRFPYETIYNVEGGSMVFTSTPSMYQLPPI